MAKSKVSLPTVKDLLKTGIQFGHETKRWNPKMSKYLFGSKNGIHIVDITKTHEQLESAVEQMTKLAAAGNVLFIGTKRQASEYVKQYAQEAGAYYIADRWVGGFFTNFKQVKTSLKRLKQLEKQFEEGVENRTKYEISRMRVEWQRLNRLYEGVKDISQKPAAVFVVDPRFEAAAVKECRLVGIPVIALTDSNCDPDKVDYVIPGNDDALGAIETVTKTMAAAVKAGNKGKGVKHDIKDYSAVDIKAVKIHEDEEEFADATPADSKVRIKADVEAKPQKSSKKSKAEVSETGILGRARDKK